MAISQLSDIFFDFDGVLIDSMEVKADAFVSLVADFDEEIRNKVRQYHWDNRGVSRVAKVEYFYSSIIKQQLTTELKQAKLNQFSDFVKKHLEQRHYLIDETVSFIREHQNRFRFHIVSASEHTELRHLCKELQIADYFGTVLGAPPSKEQLIQTIIEKDNINPSQAILVGDAEHDYKAAITNKLGFVGFNNEELRQLPCLAYFSRGKFALAELIQ